jgi:hypothetical protein
MCAGVAIREEGYDRAGFTIIEPGLSHKVPSVLENIYINTQLEHISLGTYPK